MIIRFITMAITITALYFFTSCYPYSSHGEHEYVPYSGYFYVKDTMSEEITKEYREYYIIGEFFSDDSSFTEDQEYYYVNVECLKDARIQVGDSIPAIYEKLQKKRCAGPPYMIEFLDSTLLDCM